MDQGQGTTHPGVRAPGLQGRAPQENQAGLPETGPGVGPPQPHPTKAAGDHAHGGGGEGPPGGSLQPERPPGRRSAPEHPPPIAGSPTPVGSEEAFPRRATTLASLRGDGEPEGSPEAPRGQGGGLPHGRSIQTASPAPVSPPEAPGPEPATTAPAGSRTSVAPGGSTTLHRRPTLSSASREPSPTARPALSPLEEDGGRVPRAIGRCPWLRSPSQPSWKSPSVPGCGGSSPPSIPQAPGPTSPPIVSPPTARSFHPPLRAGVHQVGGRRRASGCQEVEGGGSIVRWGFARGCAPGDPIGVVWIQRPLLRLPPGRGHPGSSMDRRSRGRGSPLLAHGSNPMAVPPRKRGGRIHRRGRGSHPPPHPRAEAGIGLELEAESGGSTRRLSRVEG